MQKILIILLCLLATNALCQSPNVQLKQVNVYGADGKSVIGRLSINAAAPGRLLLLKSIQKKDTSASYITTFYLGNKDKAPLDRVNIVMKFSKPVSVVTPAFSSAFNQVGGLSDDHITYLFKAARLNRDPGSVVVISFTIKSKDKITTDISGLDGVL